jgi:hypothetical protein
MSEPATELPIVDNAVDAGTCEMSKNLCLPTLARSLLPFDRNVSQGTGTQYAQKF